MPYYYKEIIERLPCNARILDFGCGFGQNLFAIKNNNFVWQKDNNNSTGGAAKNLILLALILIPMQYLM